MDFHVSRELETNYFPSKCDIPTPHLTFIIQLLLPKNCIGLERNTGKLQNVVRTTSKKTSDYFIIGSYSEGYNIPDVMIKSDAKTYIACPLADNDILVVLPLTVAARDEFVHQIAKDEKVTFFLEVRDVHSGYARIQNTFAHTINQGFTYKYLPEKKKWYLNAAEWQISFLREFVGSKLHGPAISEPVPKPITMAEKFKAGHNLEVQSEVDNIIALSCRNWSTVAKSWIDRQQSGDWLDDDTVQKVVSIGFHFVPVSHRHSLHPDLEWRISFAMAETFLGKEIITDYQRQCFIFLKIIHFITLKPLDILTSYHLKTVFLYTCEKLPVNTWRRNMGSCLLFMINSLIECVSRKCLPSFFIPENNLIDYFTNDEAIKVVNILINLRENPLAPVLEFTETKIMKWQIFNPSFRCLIKPVLNDCIGFQEHDSILKSVKRVFIPVLKDVVKLFLTDMSAQETFQFIKDSFSVFTYISRDNISVNGIINSNSTESTLRSVCQFLISYVQRFTSVYKDFDSYRKRIMTRYHLESICHILADMYEKDSHERLELLAKAKLMSDLEDINSLEAFDLSSFLLLRRQFDEAKTILEKFINEEHTRSRLTLFVGKIELRDSFGLDASLLTNLAEVLEDEVAVNPLSMAYYLLILCEVKLDIESADPGVYGKILQVFSKHCQKINDSTSYFLLGYCYAYTQDLISANKSFTKACELSKGSSKLLIEINQEKVKRCLNFLAEGRHKPHQYTLYD